MPSTQDSQSSITSTPPSTTRSSSYFFPVSYTVSSLLRRLNPDSSSKSSNGRASASGTTSLSQSIQSVDSMDRVFAPPRRKLSPFQPPPLTPLSLKGWRSNTPESERLLTKALAEEIRLLMPPRLQLVDEWHLSYSLEQNGVSLATLYDRADEYRGKRGGFVLVVRDGTGGVRDTSGIPSQCFVLTTSSFRFLGPT